MERMGNLVRWRRLRGLALHHRRNPSKHPRRLITRTVAWNDPIVRGVCRWCDDLTSNIHLTWHVYCLDAYRSASGQKPGQLQVTMCEGCGGAGDELDHRLAINVARALGPEALRRAFTHGEPALALPRVSQAKDSARSAAGTVPQELLDGLEINAQGLADEPRLGGRVPRSLRHCRRGRELSAETGFRSAA